MYGAAQEGAYNPSMGAPQTGYAQNYGAGAVPQMGGPPMGAPPMGMYDPSTGQPLMEHQAMAMAQAEEKNRAKAEKLKQKDVEDFTKAMRSRQRQQSDNVSCANMLCFWGILNGLLWALPLIGDSWWTKMWHGHGIQKLEVTVGLFNLETHLECEESNLDNALCHAMQPYANHNGGHWTVAEIAGHMCKDRKESCSTMNRLIYAGWTPVCFFPAAAGFEVLSILCLYLYWNMQPTEWGRGLMNKCGVLGLVCGAFGFVGWMVLSPYLQQLPRYWAAEGGRGEFANNAIFGLNEVFTFPAGWCCICAFVALISTFIRIFCQYTMPPHINEPGLDENSKLVENC